MSTWVGSTGSAIRPAAEGPAVGGRRALRPGAGAGSGRLGSWGVVGAAVLVAVAGCSVGPSGAGPSSVTASSVTSSASPSPTKTDPQEVATRQVESDVRRYVKVLLQGALANDPTFDYTGIASGAALEGIRKGFTNEYILGNRFSGTLTVRAVQVESLTLGRNLPSAVATGCVDDQAVSTNIHTKKTVGKVGGEASWTFVMSRRGKHWIASQAKAVLKDTGACTRD
jgi:hypothetical protein